MKKILFLIGLVSFTNLVINAQTGTWTALTNLAPNGNEGVMLLLTDGTVICHNDLGGTYGTGWDKLTPDIHGSYVNGTWTSISSMNEDRLFFSSQVLPSGKVYAAGGEYGPGGTEGELYDPVANTWTVATGVPSGWNIFDGNSELLYNGNVLEGPQIGASGHSFSCLFYNPLTNAFLSAPTAPLNHDEAAWLKLPDSSVLYVGIASQNSCRYIPQTNTWFTDANTTQNIYDPYGSEAGPAFMLPNGKAIFFGATQFNQLYTPTGHATTGTWAAAANFPQINSVYVTQPDAPGAMMVNGKILLAVSPIGESSNEFRTPVWFLEYNYATNTFAQVTASIPGMGADSIAGASAYLINMLNLPDGNILVSIAQAGISQYYIYTPTGSPIAQGKPTINNIIFSSCGSYKITGKLFNGISEGSAFGDDWEMSTNYPIIRLTNGTNVYYAKTTNWNRVGAVQTDSLEDTATFTLPSMPAGTYSLVVTANGFASNPTLFTVFGVTASAQTGVKCNGGNTGTASVTCAGGATPYTYSWSPSGGTSSSASNLSAGTYTVTVKDKNGCSNSTTFAITQPNILNVVANTTSNVLCNGGNGGAVSASVSGGTSPYTYSWTGGGTNSTKTLLSIGTYTITVTDKNGCTNSKSVIVTQPTQLNVTASTTANVKCNGGNTGSASSTASGGASPYTYSWSGGGTNSTKTSLSAGTYTITVTDKNGCTNSSRSTITQPTLMSVVASVSANVKCNGGNTGSASTTASGGTSPYTYSWSGGGTNSTKTSLSAGTYTISVTDKNGCTNTSTATITQPTLLSVSASVSANVLCNGGNTGSASATVSGGTSSYTYSWSPGGGTTSNKTGLSAGTYTIKITDKNGCISTASVIITQPASVLGITVASHTNVNCNGGSTGTATANPATGGTSPYTYSWSPSGGTSATASNLSAGTYTITVTDKNGCASSKTVTITQPTKLVVTGSSIANVKCNGENTGTVSATVSGGTNPYTYSWSAGGTSSRQSGLSAGTYTITITDKNGCINSDTAVITQPPAISITKGSVNATSGCDGMAGVIVIGGTGPYTYSWSPGGQRKDTAKNLCPGTYCCSITDKNGCKDSVCIDLITGIEEISNSSNIMIYPDPNKGSFTIKGLIKGQIIELYNAIGQKMKSVVAGNDIVQFDISEYPNGVYLVKIISKADGFIAQRKIVKMQ